MAIGIQIQGILALQVLSLLALLLRRNDKVTNPRDRRFPD